VALVQRHWRSRDARQFGGRQGGSSPQLVFDRFAIFFRIVLAWQQLRRVDVDWFAGVGGGQRVSYYSYCCDGLSMFSWWPRRTC